MYVSSRLPYGIRLVVITACTTRLVKQIRLGLHRTKLPEGRRSSVPRLSTRIRSMNFQRIRSATWPWSSASSPAKRPTHWSSWRRAAAFSPKLLRHDEQYARVLSYLSLSEPKEPTSDQNPEAQTAPLSRWVLRSSCSGISRVRTAHQGHCRRNCPGSRRTRWHCPWLDTRGTPPRTPAPGPKRLTRVTTDAR